jgi:benzoyl-CoA reductase/2-hydroxyglutaryl-CoA dehydratase subunit BcrC/BadD/HgdB
MNTSKCSIPTTNEKIGFTTSFPVEILFAAGYQPVDLNNIFITGNPLNMVQNAEFSGFPRNVCSWIKGIYAAINDPDNEIKTVVGIVQGDCSNTHSLMSLFKDSGIRVIPFSFPYDRDKKSLNSEIKKLKEIFGVNDEQIKEVKAELDQIRRMLRKLDLMTWLDNKVTGLENHYWLVNSSDFWGNPEQYKTELATFLEEAKEREPLNTMIRLAYIGVPPIFLDLYEFLQENRANVVFNEVQRQFSMPYLKDNIVDQYLAFTYPYTVTERLEDILFEAHKRSVNGIISYSQSFCHRQIDNILLKKNLSYPFITIEGDQPVVLDERTKLRLESFLDIIRFRS